MFQRRDVIRICAALIVPILAACSSGGGGTTTPPPAPAPGGGAAASGTTLRFENYGTNSSTAVIMLVPEAGVRRQIGQVEAGQVGTFNNVQLTPGRYKFESQGTSTRSTATFQVFANTRCVRWDMSQSNPIVSSSGC